MISVAKKKYYDTSKFTYLKGYNEDKEDEDKVEQARNQYMNTKREEIPSPTTPKRDGKYLEPVKTERKKIEFESDRPKFSFSPSRNVLGDVKKDSRTKPQQTKTDRKSPFAYDSIKPTKQDAKSYLNKIGTSKEEWKDKTKNVPFKPFREGFDRAFDPFTDLVVGTNKETKPKREEEFKEIKKANPVQSTIGNVAGEFAKYGAGYAALGPIASKAPGLAAIKNPIAKFFATEGAKDLAVGTAMRSIEGIADKQSIGEIGKNIVKDIPRNTAFNALMLGGGKALKGIKKVVGDANINKGLKSASKIVDDIKPNYSDSISSNLRPKFEAPIKPIVEPIKPSFGGSDNIGMNLRPKFEAPIKPSFIGSDDMGMNFRPKFDVSDDIFYRGEMQASNIGEKKNVLRQKNITDFIGKTPEKLYEQQTEYVKYYEDLLANIEGYSSYKSNWEA